MKRIALTLLTVITALHIVAAEWQWSVIAKDADKAYPTTAYLWIPPTCKEVKAVMMGKHNMCEETLFEMPSFRRAMEELGVALIWITPDFDNSWDVTQGTQELFEQMMVNLAKVSGYSELATAPIIPFGHSAKATYPWNFAAWNPERTLAILSYHGDAPRTNLCGYGGANLEWGRTRNIDGIPGLMIEGEYEWWEARVNPALAFRITYPESCVSFLCDAGHGHFDVSEEVAEYMALFVRKSMEYRLPTDGSKQLRKLNPHNGWLAERWRQDESRRAKAAPYARYKGDKHDAFWYFDEEMAQATELRYASTLHKQEQYLGYEQEENLVAFNPDLHARIQTNARFLPDGVTFHLKAVFTDTLRRSYSTLHAPSTPHVTRISGPVTVLNDTTFRVAFTRVGTHAPRHASSIWLSAQATGDKRYKNTVQQINVTIPFRHTQGVRQAISFQSLQDVKVGAASINLQAHADSGLPVYFYVKEGPAEVEGSRLRFTKLPPRALFPVKVTVVAWQYGMEGKVQTAEPVERSFYLVKE